MTFGQSFDDLIGIEGNYSDDENDPGNWTGGAVNAGKLKGTHWGISAAAYPDLDIVNLTRDDARAIYYRDFWQAAKCDAFQPGLGSAMFKVAVNQGVVTAAKLLQRGLDLHEDGVIGAITIGRATSLNEQDVIVDFLAESALRYAGTKNFDKYGRGWFRRVIRTALQAQT